MEKICYDNIYNVLNANRLYGEIDIDETEHTVSISISWGDWKHEHLRLDNLMQKHFSVVMIGENVTESDGSDCYSAVHSYRYA